METCKSSSNKNQPHVWAYPNLDQPGVCYYCNKKQEVAA